MKPIRVGVIGLGLIWLREHQPALAQWREVFEAIAFCDVSAERRAEAAQTYPGATIVADAAELIALPEVEAVFVLTPIAFNAPVALAALEAGKDVIMEKPIARSVAEGQALIAAARQGGRRLFVMEQLAYRQADRILADVIASGAIGEPAVWHRIQHVDADPAQGAMRFDTTPWRKAAEYPLGTLFDGGIHLVASLSTVFGPPEALYATGRKLRPEYGEFDHVVTQFHYSSGLVGLLSHSTCLSPVQNTFQIHGAAGVISVERGRLIIERPNEAQEVIELPTENPRANLWQELVTAYREGRDPSYDAEKALRDVAILEAVDRSIKTGQRLSIAPPDHSTQG
jgi:scyllo-inositol 2-dehydrogenase (NADP+)